ncbi:MAG: hypothetical protein E6L07_12495 [Verrucomicrobia bacterium]|nr:MAG: hypothetical protein E6L07_12495 [Verrucomicrobiota bacterium]
MNINTAANFMRVAFIKINRLSSFFSEIRRPKFSKLSQSWKKILTLAQHWIDNRKLAEPLSIGKRH